MINEIKEILSDDNYINKAIYKTILTFSDDLAIYGFPPLEKDCLIYRKGYCGECCDKLLELMLLGHSDFIPKLKLTKVNPTGFHYFISAGDFIIDPSHKQFHNDDSYPDIFVGYVTDCHSKCKEYYGNYGVKKRSSFYNLKDSNNIEENLIKLITDKISQYQKRERKYNTSNFCIGVGFSSVGFSGTEKLASLNRLMKLINGDIKSISHHDIRVLRNGDLGNSLRELARKFKYGSVRNLIRSFTS